MTADEAAGIYGKMGIQNLFYMSRQMAVRLSEIAEKNQVKKLPDIMLGEQKNRRFARRPELAWLEQNLFRYGTETAYTGEATDSIVFFQASNPSGEVSHIVHEIQRLVQEGKARYREIAVITGDLPGYGKEITHQFTQNQIPHFMDDKKNVLDNCLVELIRASLEAVRQDFSYESVMQLSAYRFGESGVYDGGPAGKLYLAMGIRGGKRFRETWERTYRGAGDLNVTEVNAFKDRVLAPLFAMQERFRQADLTIAGMTEAVLTLLADCQGRGTAGKLSGVFYKNRGTPTGKGVWPGVRSCNGTVKAPVRSSGRGAREPERVSGNSGCRLCRAEGRCYSGSGRPGCGGDITRTRLAHIRVLFFAGVNDGIVPARKERGSLLSDRDRDFLGEHHLELAPTARKKASSSGFICI